MMNFNQTKIKHKYWKLESLDEELLSQIFNSQFVGEWGCEFEKGDLVLFTPPSLRLDLQPSEEINKDIQNKNLYSITLNDLSFMPLYTQKPLKLFEKLSSKDVYAQFIFKQMSRKQRLTLADQYEDYLKGNDAPSHNKFMRKAQNKVLNLLDKVINAREPKERLTEAEDKILGQCFQFEIRIATKHNIQFIEAILSEMDYLNTLTIQQIDNKDTVISEIENKQLNSLIPQFLSTHEVQSLLLSEKIIRDEIEDDKETSNESTTTNTLEPSSLIHLLPIEEKKPREIDEEMVHSLPSALKTAKVIKDHKIKIEDVELGATVQRITFTIPKGMVFTDIKGRFTDIKAALGADLSIIQGHEPNTVTFLIPCKIRDIIYLKEILENPEFIKFSEENPLPFICGIDMFNNPVFKCLTKAPHLLVAGATNSGKSVFMNALLITLILLKSPNELKIYLIDPKMVEFSQYKGISHVDDVVLDMEEAVVTLSELVDEMEDRYKIFSKSKGNVKNIQTFNEKSKHKMPYIICAIDEYNDLKIQYPQVEQLIERLGQKARAAGIHLIIATQRPDKDVMSGVIKSNIPSRISFSLSSNNEYKTVFGKGIPYGNLLGFGDGVVSYVGQTEEYIRFQAPIITLDSKKEDKFYEELKKVLKGEIIKQEKQEIVIEEDPMDKLKRLIADTGETRTTELQKEMGIAIGKVSDMLKQLTEEGWFEMEGNRRKLILDEDQLNKYKTTTIH